MHSLFCERMATSPGGKYLSAIMVGNGPYMAFVVVDTPTVVPIWFRIAKYLHGFRDRAFDGRIFIHCCFYGTVIDHVMLPCVARHDTTYSKP